MDRPLADDPFNNENESFEQESRYLSNEYSVNLPTRYYFHGRWRRGCRRLSDA